MFRRVISRPNWRNQRALVARRRIIHIDPTNRAIHPITDRRLVLMTDQHAWSTAEIIGAYRGQSVVEGVFRTLKDPLRLARRPQYHWTDQKLHGHAWLCVMASLLATLVHHTAGRDADYAGSADTLFTELANIRRVTVLRPTARGRARQTHQLETPTPQQARLIAALRIPTT